MGTGASGIPAAVQIGATTGKTSALSTTTNLDDWKELMYSVLPQYRASGRAAWVANSAETLAMALRRDDTGNYIWQPSNMASEPDRLWGYPWYEDAYMDTTVSGNEPASSVTCPRLTWCATATAACSSSLTSRSR